MCKLYLLLFYFDFLECLSTWYIADYRYGWYTASGNISLVIKKPTTVQIIQNPLQSIRIKPQISLIKQYKN